MIPEITESDPFSFLASAAAKVVADGWTVAMLGLWNAGLWALRFVLNLMDDFLVPDLRTDGPAAEVYRTAFWLAGTLVVILAMVQLGVAAFRRDGRSLAQVVVGAGQFVIVWAGWITYGVALVAACGGLTRALMQSLLNVNSWSAWQPWEPVNVDDITDATVATVLGLMGLLLWLAAIGHLLVMLTRAGALMVLAATTPVSAAGLVSDLGRDWFWKSLRWFHAAALTPVLMVLVLGVGVQMTTGVANGLAEDSQAGIGTALPGVILILIGCFTPLALFRLLAFVEPGTTSGAAMRQGLAAQGGLQGLLAGSSSAGGAGATSGAASSSDSTGRAQGESAGEDATSSRFTASTGQFLSSVGGALGSAAATGLGVMSSVATAGAAVGSDIAGQMGAGHNTYHPDFIAAMANRGPQRATNPSSNNPGSSNPAGGRPTGPGDSPDGSGGDGNPAPTPPAPTPPIPTPPPSPPVPPSPPSGGSDSGSQTGSGSGFGTTGTGGGAAAGGRAAGGASSAEVAAVAL